MARPSLPSSGFGNTVVQEAGRVKDESRRYGANGPVPFRRDMDSDITRAVLEARIRIQELRQYENLRAIGGRTDTNHETVRRYLSAGAEPSFRFVLAAIRAYGLSAEWVLFGTGSPFLKDVPENVLGQAEAGDLLRHFGHRLNAMSDQVSVNKENIAVYMPEDFAQVIVESNGA